MILAARIVVVELRAAIVVSAASACSANQTWSTDFPRCCLRWVNTPTQPIAIRDVLDYLGLRRTSRPARATPSSRSAAPTS